MSFGVDRPLILVTGMRVISGDDQSDHKLTVMMCVASNFAKVI
jgi:hypothetical protein